jgi:THO complex subunit 1
MWYGNTEQCEAGLIFWLIEELLDSQTVDGCRKVFDYLESRREINTAVWTSRKSFYLGHALIWP